MKLTCLRKCKTEELEPKIIYWFFKNIVIFLLWLKIYRVFHGMYITHHVSANKHDLLQGDDSAKCFFSKTMCQQAMLSFMCFSCTVFTAPIPSLSLSTLTHLCFFSFLFFFFFLNNECKREMTSSIYREWILVVLSVEYKVILLV
jgi:hypothetical protein